MKKIFYVLIVTLLLMTSACSINLKNENKKAEENQKVKNNVENKETKQETEMIENEDVAGTYFVLNDYSNEIANDEYLTLNTDGTFFKQVNFCAGIRHVTGTWEASQKNDIIALQFKVDGHDDITIPSTLSDDVITIKNKISDINDDGRYVPVSDFFSSCGNWINDGDYNIMKLKKGSDSDIRYLEEMTAQIGPY